jgi:membrane dipeptidase
MTTQPIDALLTRWPVFDGHNDLPYRLRSLGHDSSVAIDRVERSHTDLDRLQAGGVGAQWWSVWVPGDIPEPEAVVQVLEQIERVHRFVARHPRRTALCTSADEVEAARASGRLASLIGAEGGHSIASSLDVLRALVRLGMRYMTLTHNQSTAWADSATDAPRADGLSDFGREVVAEMERLGVLVDLSHVAVTTMHAALDVAARPVLFSHSSARAVCDHVRNVPDEVLRRLPGNGGVCKVTFVAQFLSKDVHVWESEELPARLTQAGVDPDDDEAVTAYERSLGSVAAVATVQQVADHVEHVREVCGVQGVGIGGDYDGCRTLARGLEDVSCYPALLDELRARRWSDDDLGALTWRNALRVLRGG